MKIYLSLFEAATEYKKNRTLEAIQIQLLNQLSINKIDFFDGSKFTDYKNIFDQIESSKVFVALIDSYWCSSTWKMIELYYASGKSQENEGQFIQSPKNCYIYNEPNNQNPNLLFNLPNVFSFNGSYSDLMVKISEHKSGKD